MNSTVRCDEMLRERRGLWLLAAGVALIILVTGCSGSSRITGEYARADCQECFLSIRADGTYEMVDKSAIGSGVANYSTGGEWRREGNEIVLLQDRVGSTHLQNASEYSKRYKVDGRTLVYEYPLYFDPERWVRK
jgi:hypothetical protein